MLDLSSEIIVARIHQVHGWLLKSVDSMSEEQFTHAPGTVAPPIGWHLWHTARWADRLQASLPKKTGAASHRAGPERRHLDGGAFGRIMGARRRALGQV